MDRRTWLQLITILAAAREAHPQQRGGAAPPPTGPPAEGDRKSTRLNSSHLGISYAVFCLKKKPDGTPLAFQEHVPLRHVRRRVVRCPVSGTLNAFEPRVPSGAAAKRCVIYCFFFNNAGPPEFSPLPLPAAFPI